MSVAVAVIRASQKHEKLGLAIFQQLVFPVRFFQQFFFLSVRGGPLTLAQRESYTKAHPWGLENNIGGGVYSVDLEYVLLLN